MDNSALEKFIEKEKNFIAFNLISLEQKNIIIYSIISHILFGFNLILLKYVSSLNMFSCNNFLMWRCLFKIISCFIIIKINKKDIQKINIIIKNNLFLLRCCGTYLILLFLLYSIMNLRLPSVVILITCNPIIIILITQIFNHIIFNLKKIIYIILIFIAGIIIFINENSYNLIIEHNKNNRKHSLYFGFFSIIIYMTISFFIISIQKILLIKRFDIIEQNIYSNIASFIISFSISLLNRTVFINFNILIISLISVIISLFNEQILTKNLLKINNRIYSITSLIQQLLIIVNNILFINEKIYMSDIIAYFIIFLYYINNYFLLK